MGEYIKMGPTFLLVHLWNVSCLHIFALVLFLFRQSANKLLRARFDF
jgi:hypothetical protein